MRTSQSLVCSSSWHYLHTLCCCCAKFRCSRRSLCYSACGFTPLSVVHPHLCQVFTPLFLAPRNYSAHLIITSESELASEANYNSHPRVSQASSTLGDLLAGIWEAAPAEVNLVMTWLATQHAPAAPPPPTTCLSQVSPAASSEC